jgi:hypothetical protein
VTDDGAGFVTATGGARTNNYSNITGVSVDGDQIIGTINYGTGAIVINQSVVLKGQVYIPQTTQTTTTTGADQPSGGTWNMAIIRR